MQEDVLSLLDLLHPIVLVEHLIFAHDHYLVVRVCTHHLGQVHFALLGLIEQLLEFKVANSRLFVLDPTSKLEYLAQFVRYFSNFATGRVSRNRL